MQKNKNNPIKVIYKIEINYKKEKTKLRNEKIYSTREDLENNIK